MKIYGEILSKHNEQSVLRPVSAALKEAITSNKVKINRVFMQFEYFGFFSELNANILEGSNKSDMM